MTKFLSILESPETKFKLHPHQKALYAAICRGDKIEVTPYRRSKSRLYSLQLNFAKKWGCLVKEEEKDGAKILTYDVLGKTWLFYSKS